MDSITYVGLDVHKATVSVAVAESGRGGEVRQLGVFENRPEVFDGVFQLPPGHYLLATDRHVQLHRYWDFDYTTMNGSAAQRADADYAAEFRQALEEAVRIRLRADVPVGCYLSQWQPGAAGCGQG
jgi:asparagine synthetase B (glutamine-hydrolysing)